MKYPISLLLLSGILTGCGSDSNNPEPTPENITTTSALTLSGTLRADQTISTELTLTDDNGTTNATATYQWFANEAVIPNQSSATAKLDISYTGQTIYVEASFTDDDGYNETVQSDSFVLGEKFRLTLLGDNSGSWTHSQSLDYGENWSAPAGLVVSDPGTEEIYEIDIASDGNGNLVAVAYSESSTIYGDLPVIYSRSHDNGETWSDTDRISLSGNDSDVVIDYNGEGTWIAAWQTKHPVEASGTDNDIVYAISTDNGIHWSSPKLVGTLGSTDSTNIDSMPTISANGDNWFVAWRSANDLGATIGSDSDVIYSTTSNGGLTWSAPQALNSDAGDDDPAANGNNIDYFPIVDISPTGFGIAVWTGQDDSDLDIFAAVTHDFGVTWSNASMVNSYGNLDAASDGDYPSSVIANKDGTCVITWEGRYEAENGTDTEPMYSVSIDNGVTWSDARSMKSGIDSDGVSEIDNKILENPNGGWIGAWSEGSNIWITTSDDLINWSAPEDSGSDSGDPFGWIFH